MPERFLSLVNLKVRSRVIFDTEKCIGDTFQKFHTSTTTVTGYFFKCPSTSFCEFAR